MEQKTANQVLLESARMECGYCGAPHQKLWETEHQCPVFKQDMKDAAKINA